MATILQVSISRGGLPKRAIDGGIVGPLGIEGDGHAHPQVHGGPRKALLIVAAEVVERLQALGYPVFYGALGENLTTRGLDLRSLRIGDQVRAGGAMLEITQPRIPCAALDVYGQSIQQEIFDPGVQALDPAAPHWGMSGLYASVHTPGFVAPGDIIAVVATFA